MKNILLVTYYYEPYNIVASRRPESWATYLSDFYNITVLTRSWTGKENGIDDITIENKKRSLKKISNSLEISYIPYIKQAKKINNFNNPIVRKLKGYYKHFLGKFSDIEFIEENFEKEIYGVIKDKQIDLVIYTCNPYLFLPISQNLYKTTGVKFIIDFRDILSAVMLKKTPGFKELLYQKIMTIRLKYHTKNAAALITVSEPLNRILSKIYRDKVYTIYNGYNESVLNELLTIEENKNKFTITYTGNLSPAMNTEIFLKGITLFLEKCNPDIEINFIGVSEEYKIKLSEFNKSGIVKIFNWLPHQDALKLSKQSSVLIYMGWKGYTGILSGKIFDYLGLRRTILLAPSDNDVIEELLLNTGAGIIANTEIEVCEFFEKKYKEWKENGCLAYKANIDRIKEFTRENQAKKLVNIINSII